MRAIVRALILAAGLGVAAPVFADTYDDMLRAIEIDDARGIASLLKRGAAASMAQR